MAAPQHGGPGSGTSAPSQPVYGGADQDEGEYVWRIEDYATFKEQTPLNKLVRSPYFDLIGHRWRLLFRYQPDRVYVAIYLKMEDEPLPKPVNGPKVAFKIACFDPQNDESVTEQDTTAVFRSGWDQGWCEAFTVSMLDAYVGQGDGAAHIRVRVKDLTETTAASLGSDYDSRKATGFVGLLNQGATCYMNSYLQSLFHSPRFRDALYAIQHPAPDEDASRSQKIGMALQHLFYKLQTSKEAPDTVDLTQSFGWTERDAFLQHDVQEFSRVLCDAVEGVMKGTPVEDTVNQLFQGKSEMFVECINVDFSSRRTESFLDLQLNVKGCESLEASLRQYIEVETLDGDNQYRAEDEEKGINHGKQDARKGCKFIKFPPILQLQLKRFQYDPMTDRMAKVNEHFSFPARLDVTEFLSPEHRSQNPQDPDVYHLHSVLVHQGSALGGHYFSFIRPVTDNYGSYAEAPWFKFNDEHVMHVKPKEAVQGCFGGPHRLGNAYMLVYMRESETRFRVPFGQDGVATGGEPVADGAAEPPSKRTKTANGVVEAMSDVVATGPVAVGAVPGHIVRQLQQQKEAKRLRRAAVQRARELVAVDVIWERDLFGEVMGCGLQTLQEHFQGGFAISRLRATRSWEGVERTWSIEKLLKNREQELGVPHDHIEHCELGAKLHRRVGSSGQEREQQGSRDSNGNEWDVADVGMANNARTITTLADLIPPSEQFSSDARVSLFLREKSMDNTAAMWMACTFGKLHLFKYFDVQRQALLYLGSARLRTKVAKDVALARKQAADALLRARGLLDQREDRWLSTDEYFRRGLPWRDSEGIILNLRGLEDPRPVRSKVRAVVNSGRQVSPRKRKRQIPIGETASPGECDEKKDTGDTASVGEHPKIVSVSAQELRWASLQAAQHGSSLQAEQNLQCELEPTQKGLFKSASVAVVLVSRNDSAVEQEMSQLHEEHVARHQTAQHDELGSGSGEQASGSDSLLPTPLRSRLSNMMPFHDSARDAAAYWRNTTAWLVEPDPTVVEPLQFKPLHMSVTHGRTTLQDALRHVAKVALGGKIDPAYLRAHTTADVQNSTIMGTHRFSTKEQQRKSMRLLIRATDHTEEQLRTHRLIKVDYCGGPGKAQLFKFRVLLPRDGGFTLGDLRKQIAQHLKEHFPEAVPEHGIHVMRKDLFDPELPIGTKQLDDDRFAFGSRSAPDEVYAVARTAHDVETERHLRKHGNAKSKWKEGGRVGPAPTLPEAVAGFRKYITRYRLKTGGFSSPIAELYGVPVPVFWRSTSSLEDVRTELRTRLGVAPELFDKWTLALLSKGYQGFRVKTTITTQDEWQYARKQYSDEKSCIGVCDPNAKPVTRPRVGALQAASAIKIGR